MIERVCCGCGAAFRPRYQTERDCCYSCQPAGRARPAIKPCRWCGAKIVGRRHYCAGCFDAKERVRLREREQTRVRISRPVTMVAEKRCSRCRKLKPAAAFYSHFARADGLAADCGECSRAHRKETRRQRRGA